MRTISYNGVKIQDGKFIQSLTVYDGGGVPQGIEEEVRVIRNGNLEKEDNPTSSIT